MRVGRGRKTAGGEAHLVVAGQDIGREHREQSILARARGELPQQGLDDGLLMFMVNLIIRSSPSRPLRARAFS